MRIQKHGHIYKLDRVLRILAEGCEEKINNNVPIHQMRKDEVLIFLKNETPSIELNDYELWLILDKLIYDKYIISYEKGFLFSVNYNGYLFNKSGGYQAQKNNELMSVKRKNQLDFLMTFGTWAAGIGTISLVIIEILKHFYWHT